VFNTEYVYAGGTHPVSYFSADNFRVDIGHRLDLSEVMGLSMEQALAKLYSEAIAQIKTAEGAEDFFYYEDYEQIVRNSFKSEDFLLAEENLLFFYQYYTLYPYVGGYPVFHLAYDQRGAAAPAVTPIANQEEERELHFAAGHLLDRNRDIQDGGMGYYTNWNDYRFALSDITSTNARLTVYTENNSPAGREDETLTVKLEKVDGYWVMERMVY